MSENLKQKAPDFSARKRFLLNLGAIPCAENSAVRRGFQKSRVTEEGVWLFELAQEK
jgi:hypothetical protein